VAQDIATSEALAEQQKKAAEVMAERLPTVKPEVLPEGDALSPALKQPPPPLHPDRFSAGATPPASAMQPGVPAPVVVPAPKVKADATPSEDAAAAATPPVKKPKPPVQPKADEQTPAATPPAAATPTPAPQENK
jgi:hypothetical protein